MMKNIASYVKQSKQELLKVIFPTRGQVKSAFISVCVVVVFISLFLALLDFIMSSLLGLFV